MSEMLSYARNTVSHYLSTQNTENGVLPDENAIDASVALQSSLMALSNLSHFNSPKIIVVGTQSSGKSSLLNALMGIDILPVGDTMTTRTAIHVQLIHSKKEKPHVDFGNYVDGEWHSIKSLDIDPAPTSEQQELIKREIHSQTFQKTTTKKSISYENAISFRLYASSVPNICFVDLPGLTMTALTSEGQPVDMCEKIREMITTYTDERTIILMVCAARPDLEADSAVELCKKLTGGSRTIGCLTKVDLCDADVTTYIEGTQAADLHLEHGYFAVKCRTNQTELTHNTVTEKKYFSSHSQFRCVTSQKRLGVVNLAVFLHKLYINEIRSCLPQLRKDLQILYEESRREYSTKIGSSVPLGSSERLVFANEIVCKFANTLKTSFTARRPDASAGRLVRHTFGELGETARSITPFESDSFTDAEIMKAVQNCEGWSMISPIPPIGLVEFFLQHPVKQPIQQLLVPCSRTLDDIKDHLQKTSDEIIDEIHRFSNVKVWLQHEMQNVLESLQTETQKEICQAISVEEAYIFTDNAMFIKEWSIAMQKASTIHQSYPNALRQILAAYYKVVVESVVSYIPKIIVYALKNVLENLQTKLTTVLHGADINNLLLEDEDTETLRARLTTRINTSESCIKTIDSALT
jgi:GTPase SAR1 family protein